MSYVKRRRGAGFPVRLLGGPSSGERVELIHPINRLKVGLDSEHAYLLMPEYVTSKYGERVAVWELEPSAADLRQQYIDDDAIYVPTPGDTDE